MTPPGETTSTNGFGTAELDPVDDVIAGSRGTWRLTYTAGQSGIQPGGRIRIYCDSDTDRALPQFGDPSGPEYTTITAPDGVQVDALVQPFKTLVLTFTNNGQVSSLLYPCRVLIAIDRETYFFSQTASKLVGMYYCLFHGDVGYRDQGTNINRAKAGMLSMMPSHVD